MKTKTITVILTLIAVLAPLLIMPSASNYYTIPKVAFLLPCGLLLLILLFINYKTLKIDKKDILVLIFLGLIFLSVFVSYDLKTSIIGSEYRYEGLLMVSTYVLIYLCAKKYFKYENLNIFLNIMFYVLLVIGILGILQMYLNIPALYPIFNQGICSTFGNSNFFGSFISLILPICIAVFIIKGNKRSFLLSNIFFWNMISSGTRSTWVGFIAVLVFFIIFLIIKRNFKYFKRATILLVFFVLIYIYLFSSSKAVTESQVNALAEDIQTAATSGINPSMGSCRIEIWNATLKLIVKKPILGCGVDDLANGLFINCSEEAFAFSERTGVYIDKAHNEYLQIAATSGIPSLIIYLTFGGIILFPKMGKMFKDKSYFIICLSIICYITQALFNISTIGIAPLFWMILGLSDNNCIKESLDKLLN